MPISDEQLDAWFTYHPPADEMIVAKHALIGKHARLCDAFVLTLIATDDDATLDPDLFEQCNQHCRAFVKAIDEQAPDGADKSAAIRCVRLARGAINRFVHARSRSNARYHKDVLRIARDEFLKAEVQANAAIALAGRPVG